MRDQVYTVTELNTVINQTLEYAYPDIVVEGEISSYKVSQNKWIFFDIKDDNTSIACFMSIYQLKTPLEDGMLVRLHCSPKLTNWGKFSLTVKTIELVGEGSVKKSFEILRAQLEKEGLFDISRKRTLPPYPERIALITSRQAAAYNDFITILNDRWAGITIDLFQVQVQGEVASEQIISALDYFNKNSTKYDLLVLIRGGGSLEDLQTFATEEVTRAIYGSKIPTVVGVGHEDDISLAELAADLRAATPTDAARLIAPDKHDMVPKIISSMHHQNQLINNIIINNENKVLRFENTFTNFIHKTTILIDNYNNILQSKINAIFNNHQLRFEKSVELLRSLDPSAVLARGYAIVKSENKAVLQSSQLQVGQDIMVQLHKGSVRAKVRSIHN